MSRGYYLQSYKRSKKGIKIQHTQDQDTKKKKPYDWMIISLVTLVFLLVGVGLFIYKHKVKLEKVKEELLDSLSYGLNFEDCQPDIDKIKAVLNHYPGLKRGLAPTLRKYECKLEEYDASELSSYYTAREEYAKAAKVWMDMKAKYPENIFSSVDESIQGYLERETLEPRFEKVYTLIREGNKSETIELLSELDKIAKDSRNGLEVNEISDSLTNKRIMMFSSRIMKHIQKGEIKEAEKDFLLIQNWYGSGRYLEPSVKERALEVYQAFKGNSEEFEDWYDSLPLTKTRGIMYFHQNSPYLLQKAHECLDYVILNCKDIETIDQARELKAELVALEEWKQLNHYIPFSDFYDPDARSD